MNEENQPLNEKTNVSIHKKTKRVTKVDVTALFSGDKDDSDMSTPLLDEHANEENQPLNEKTIASVHEQTKRAVKVDMTALSSGKKDNSDATTPLLDKQWTAMTQDWQSQPVPKTDIIALLKQTKRRTLWAKACLGFNVLAMFGIFIAFFISLYRGEYGTPMNTYLGLAGLIMVILVYYETRIRLKTWRQCCDSPDKAIDNATISCKSSINYMILNKLSCIPFAVMGNWFVVATALENDRSMWKGLILLNVFLIVVYVVADRLHRKYKKEYQRLTSLR